MRRFIQVTKAIADTNRIKILKMLQHKMMCVCELQAALNIAQPTVSKHLRVLEEAGLVDYRKDGLWVNYYLSDGRRNSYAESMLGKLRHWLEDSPEIHELVEKLPYIRREEICRREDSRKQKEGCGG